MIKLDKNSIPLNIMDKIMSKVNKNLVTYQNNINEDLQKKRENFKETTKTEKVTTFY